MVAAAIGLLAIAAVVFIATFRADSYKPRIAAAVQAATGRSLALNGPIGLAFSLHPTIELRDVALANPPGFSRPDMARIQAIELQLDLIPLLHQRIAIRRLVLVHPDILLERTAQGQTNWQFAVRHPPTAPAPPTVPQSRARQALVSVTELRVEDGVFAYRDDHTGHVALVSVPTLAATAASAESPLHVAADAAVNGLSTQDQR